MLRKYFTFACELLKNVYKYFLSLTQLLSAVVVIPIQVNPTRKTLPTPEINTHTHKILPTPNSLNK